MSLDLNKPLRFKQDKRPVKFLSCLNNGSDSNIVIVRGDEGNEYLWVCKLVNLENIPESRWLNVYVGDSVVMPKWHESRESADRVTTYKVDRVAVIEDKQDGSDWIVHRL